MKKLTIIIPYYNTKEYTVDLINCLDKQMNNDVEVILVDDGSKDAFTSSCEWLNIVRKENGGVSSARNIGLNMAKGEYIAFIDSDDLVSPNYIQTILDKIEEGFDYCCMSWKAFHLWDITVKLNSIDDNFPEWNLCCWNRIYRRSKIIDIRFNEKKIIAEDAEFIREVEKKCKNKSYIGDILYLYRAGRDGSLTQSYIDGKIKFKRIVYNYNRITKDMSYLIDEVKELNKENEVIIMTNYNELPELKYYAMVTKPAFVTGSELRGEYTDNFKKEE